MCSVSRLGSLVRPFISITRCMSLQSVNTTSLLPIVQFVQPFRKFEEPVTLPIPHIIPLNISNNNLERPSLIDPKIIRNTIEEPNGTQTIIEAARLIVIRRKKMKKHKLKKLRKRMYYQYAKKRQRRELKKEKEFHAVLIAQCKEAEAFDAKEYVLNKLKEATAKPPIHFFDTPEFKELMRIKKLRLNVK